MTESLSSAPLWSRLKRGFETRVLRRTEHPTTQHLWQERPPELQDRIAKVFSTMNPDTVSGFIWHGSEKYYFGSKGKVSAQDVVLAIINEKPSGPIDVLDIGPGTGKFIEWLNHTYNHSRSDSPKLIPHAIGAHTYWRSPQELAVIGMKIGNAENLLQYFAPNSMDVVVSQMTFMHLVDRLGTLAQAYEVLKPGGVLMVDELESPGLEGQQPALVNYLNSHGYQVAATYDYRIYGEEVRPCRFNSLVIRKTKPFLELPIKYNGLTKYSGLTKGRAQYALTAPLTTASEVKLSAKMVEFLGLMRQVYGSWVDEKGYYEDEIFITDSVQGLHGTAEQLIRTCNAMIKDQERIGHLENVPPLEGVKKLMPDLTASLGNQFLNTEEPLKKQVQKRLKLRV